MTTLLPAPIVSIALFVLWLALDLPPSAAQVALALAVAILVPLVVAPLRPYRPRVRRPGLAFKLAFDVLHDALVSNVEVARALMRSRDALPAGGFVRVPLDLDEPGALAALAIITTIVPGTVWCELANDRSAVLLHVLDPGDEAAFVAHYKARYERPLKEIFG
jgi:multicomponent K+:H+ antiporter subunit E